MNSKTFMSTDWIEVHDHGSAYMARVFLTDGDEAYMKSVMDGKQMFFKVDPNLLKIGELQFFEKVMECAEEIPIETANDIGLLDR